MLIILVIIIIIIIVIIITIVTMIKIWIYKILVFCNVQDILIDL